MVSAKNVKNKNSAECHDCSKKIKIVNGKIKNGVKIKYKIANKEYIVFKCNECFKKDQSLKNFQKCEVYSRVVGYLRPVQQWNEGKQKEFEERKNFTT